MFSVFTRALVPPPLALFALLPSIFPQKPALTQALLLSPALFHSPGYLEPNLSLCQFLCFFFLIIPHLAPSTEQLALLYVPWHLALVVTLHCPSLTLFHAPVPLITPHHL